MTVTDRLLRVGSMAESLGAYLPAKLLQKGLGSARLFLLFYLLSKTELALWGIGAMIVTLAAPMLTLGTNHGMTRYASYYEVRGQLEQFYRRQRWRVVRLTAATTCVAALLTVPALMLLSRVTGQAVPAVFYWMALANGMLLAVHYNVMGIIIGARAYRLVAAIEVLFAALLLGIAVPLVLVWPTAVAVLTSHAVALVISLAMALLGLHRLLPRVAAKAVPVDQLESAAVEAITEAESVTGLPHLEAGPASQIAGDFRQVLFFGLAALPGFVLWEFASKTSFLATSWIRGSDAAAEFLVFFALGQPLVFLADSVWAVVFTHAARRWEAGEKTQAVQSLQTAYKAVALAMMTAAVALWATASLWVRVLPERYHGALSCLPGLLMFFAVMIHLALVTMVAKLHERPWLTALAAVGGICINAGLAVWWLRGSADPPASAAWAAGIGMFVGAGVATAAYLAAAKVPIGWPTGIMQLAPAIFLLPIWLAGGIWAVLLVATFWTPWLFDLAEKNALSRSLLEALAMIRRRRCA